MEPSSSLKSTEESGKSHEADGFWGYFMRSVSITLPKAEMPKRHHVTWADLRGLVTTRNILLCLPSFSLTSAIIFVIAVSVPFYGSLGVNSDLTLLFVALSRALEAIVDPFVAQWYESVRIGHPDEPTLRTRACLGGSLVGGIMIGLHLSPPSSFTDTTALVGWFAWTYIGFFCSMSFAFFPLTAMVWQAFPYNGAKDLYQRATLSLVTEMLQFMGLALAFMLYGYSSAAREADDETSAVYGSCYSDTGMGTSCLALPNSGKRVHYDIFNATAWNANANSTCNQHDSVVYTDPQLLFTPHHCLGIAAAGNASCLSEYCACVGQCTNLHELYARRSYVGAAGWVLGCVLMASVTALLLYTYGWKHVLHPEWSPSQHNQGEDGQPAPPPATNVGLPPEPLVPKLIGLFRNKVVRSFLLPWLCDTVAFMMVLGTVAYYIRAVIRPEYALSPVDCNAATPIFGTDSAAWRCQNRAVASLLLAVIMLSALFSSLLWNQFSHVVGTVRAWQLGSLLSFLCILALVFSASHGQTSKAIGLGMLMGVGFGSRFLSEVVVVEVIHYYQFISGYQYQHTFALFKLQFLKMSVLFMQLLPIAVFYEVNFDPNPAMYKKVPEDIRVEESLSQIFTVAVPCALCLASFFLKMQFRLVDEEQFDLTAEGIRLLLHRTERAAQVRATVVEPPTKGRKSQRAKTETPQETLHGIDPTSGIPYPAALLSYEDMQTAQIFAHFADVQNTIDYHSCAHSQSPYIGVDLLINRTRDIAAVTFFLAVALAVGMVFAADLLHTQSGMLFVPLLMIIMMGWAAMACYCAFLSLQAAILLKDTAHQPTVEVLDRIISNLDTLADIALVDLPTREVLRRVRVAQAPAAAAVAPELGGDKSRSAEEAKKSLDAESAGAGKHTGPESRASKEVQELLAAEAYKASIPTKEMEVLEWEQALFRAAKRALARSKVPSQRALKLVKALQRSSRLDPGPNPPPLSRWEVEFYNYVLAQRRQATGEGGSDETKSNSTMSDDSGQGGESGQGHARRRANADDGDLDSEDGFEISSESDGGVQYTISEGSMSQSQSRNRLRGRTESGYTGASARSSMRSRFSSGDAAGSSEADFDHGSRSRGASAGAAHTAGTYTQYLAARLSDSPVVPHAPSIDLGESTPNRERSRSTGMSSAEAERQRLLSIELDPQQQGSGSGVEGDGSGDSGSGSDQEEGEEEDSVDYSLPSDLS